MNNIKDLCTIKANKKIYLIGYIYNNNKKNLILMHLLKILEVSQNISFCFVAIIWNNDNNNINFDLQNIT